MHPTDQRLAPDSSRWVVLYRALLVLYPARHRRDYGPAMEQLFRDQCRDARRLGGRPALARLLLRSAVDLLINAARERCDQICHLPVMHPRLRAILIATLAGAAVSAAVFTAVVLVAYSIPPTFLSYARVSVDSPLAAPPGRPFDPWTLQTEMELLRSQEILRRVADHLGLDQRWGHRRHAAEATPTAATMTRLREALDVRQYRNTAIFEIRAYDHDRDFAARLANAVVAAYLEVRSASPGGPAARLIDPAEPGLRPVRPNRPLLLAVGLLGSGLLGAGVALVTRFAGYRRAARASVRRPA